MINVFDYSDFRSYLRDWYNDKKNENPNYSYQLLADRAGIKNKGFIYNIVKGNKQISQTNCFRISKALGHNKYEAEYFKNLVAFNQSTVMTDRKYYFDKMNCIPNMGKPLRSAQVLRKDQYEYFSTWYHAVTRSLIGIYTFKDDYRWLARMVNPSLKITEARRSVQLLARLGMIFRDEQGVWRISSNSVTTGPDIMSVAFQNFHLACNDLAKRAIHEFPLEKRNVTGLTLGISEKKYRTICKEIEEFQDRIINIADGDDEADRVYQMNFHFFPTSNHDQKKDKNV